MALSKRAFHEPHIFPLQRPVSMSPSPWSLFVDWLSALQQRAELIKAQRGEETLQLGECRKHHPHFLILIYADRVNKAFDLFLIKQADRSLTVQRRGVLHGSTEGTLQMRRVFQENALSSGAINRCVAVLLSGFLRFLSGIALELLQRCKDAKRCYKVQFFFFLFGPSSVTNNDINCHPGLPHECFSI